MKKFLIASTAIVALSGAAAAEITLSGDAQIGLKYDNKLPTATGTTSGWNVQQRVRMTVTMTGETDSGLSFGAKFRPGESDYYESRDRYEDAATVWAEGSYGKITVGDVDSAIEQAVGDLAEVGNSGLEFYNEIGYAATDAYDDHDNKGLVYSYKFGDATVLLSFEDQYDGYSGDKIEGNVWSIGAKYDVNQYSFGIGYSAGADYGWGDLNTWGVSASGDFNGLTLKALWVQGKDDFDKYKQYGISADYTMANGVGLKGFYRINDDTGVAGKEKILGLGASYDLGGGASVNGGLVHVKDGEVLGNPSRTIADFGVKFAF